MPHGAVSELISAPADEVFRLLHDYDRRLEWDTLLAEAYLSGGFKSAEVGATSVCRGRKMLGGFAVETRYVSFRPGEVAAVKLVNHPPFFDTFAATIRHEQLTNGASSVEYIYNFTARPCWLRFVLHPLMNMMFKFATKKRLRALRRFFQRSS
jgi:hypothetical protein